MKNSKNFLNFRKLDFTAIQIFLSIIAISLAGMVVDASPSIAKLDFRKPAISSVASELKTCSISYTGDSCERPTLRLNSCELGSTDIFQTLKLSPQWFADYNNNNIAPHSALGMKSQVEHKESVNF